MLPYRRLEVHELALEVTDRIFDLVEAPAIRKRFWFVTQLCSAVGSISANIAEGNGRSTPLDYASFVDKARGSTFEVDNWLLLADRRGWLPAGAYRSISTDLDRLSAMLFRLANQLRRKAALESRTTASAR